MSKRNQNYTNRKQNRFQPERMRGTVFVNNSGKQWLPGENVRAAKVERLLRGTKEKKKEIAGNMAGYKDSGIEYIGQIPKDWEVLRLKNISDIYAAKEGLFGEWPVEKNGKPYSPFGEWSSGNEVIITGRVGTIGQYEMLEKNPKKKILINDNRLLIFPFTEDYRKKALSHFLFWAMAIVNLNDIITGSAVPLITATSLLKKRIVVPPLHEQQRIADFLDTKCDILDRTIDAVSRQIEDLEKYKKALITETVTKGICKKSKPERAMKDSGVEWIGEDIPFDWDINRLQFCIDEISERNYAGKETHILSLMKDKGVIPYEEKGRVGNISKTDLTQYKLAYPNTLITNSMNIIIGSSGISQYKGCVSPAYYVFKAKPNNDIRYFNYIFAVRAFQNECRRFANGILEIRLRISSTNLLKIKVPVPSPEEQQQIADYLDEKCKNIDNRVQKRRQQLGWLKEYKKSLIFDYVTGKKRV